MEGRAGGAAFQFKLTRISAGCRLGPGGHKPPKSCPGPQIFDWFRSALFLLEGF